MFQQALVDQHGSLPRIHFVKAGYVTASDSQVATVHARDDLATGLESRTDIIPNVVTGLIDEAARRNNELKPGEVLS